MARDELAERADRHIFARAYIVRQTRCTRPAEELEYSSRVQLYNRKYLLFNPQSHQLFAIVCTSTPKGQQANQSRRTRVSDPAAVHRVLIKSNPLHAVRTRDTETII